MFIVSLSYKERISEVEKFIGAHVQYLDKYYAERKFIFSDRKNPRTVGIIVVRNVDRDSLIEIIKQGPFHQNEIAD
ncbi:MAG: YciI family protein [Ginsengibacter sp.]